MTECFKLNLKNRISEIVTLNNRIEELNMLGRIPDRLFFYLNLVLEEIFTNVINYGYEDDDDHEVLICFNFQYDLIEIEVSDDGKEFNPLIQPEPNLNSPIDEREIGGLGIFIVKQLMDSVEYSRESGKNVLRLKKVV